MPIILASGWSNPAPPATATSPDGVLTVTADAANGGVLLRADFSGLATHPKYVRFLRGSERVRSGDPARSPGGHAVAYDAEAPLGGTSTWTAVPLDADEEPGTSSAGASLLVPAPTGSRTLWVKSLDRPSLSMAVTLLRPLPSVSRGARVALHEVPGDTYPGGSWDVRSARQVSLQALTATLAERDQMWALLDSGILLVQGIEAWGLGGLYALPGDVDEAYVGSVMSDQRRIWTIPLAEQRRPATLDSPLYVPGKSYGDSLAAAATYAARLSMWPTYGDRL